MDDTNKKKEGALPVWSGEINTTPILDMGWEAKGWSHDGLASYYCDVIDEYLDDSGWIPKALINEEESAVGPVNNLYLLVGKEGNPDMRLLLCKGVKGGFPTYDGHIIPYIEWEKGLYKDPSGAFKDLYGTNHVAFTLGCAGAWEFYMEDIFHSDEWDYDY